MSRNVSAHVVVIPSRPLNIQHKKYCQQKYTSEVAKLVGGISTLLFFHKLIMINSYD